MGRFSQYRRLDVRPSRMNSNLKRNTCGPSEDLGRGPIGEAFPGTMGQFFHDRRKPVRRDP